MSPEYILPDLYKRAADRQKRHWRQHGHNIFTALKHTKTHKMEIIQTKVREIASLLARQRHCCRDSTGKCFYV